MAKKRRKGRVKRKRLTLQQLQEWGVDVEQFRVDQPGAQLQLKACREPVVAGPKMNKTEQRYERYLQGQKDVGLIAGFVFEPIKLRLGPDWTTSYMPDFAVYLLDGVLELHEVKGASNSDSATWGAWWEEDAKLKIKMAAGLYPFRFVGVHERDGTWKRKVFKPEKD